MRILILIGLLLAPAVLFAQKPETDDEEEPAARADRGHAFQFKFKDRPSFRIGEAFKLDIKSKWHLDFRKFYPPVTNLPLFDDNTFLLTRARFGIKGKVTKYFAFEFEREMRKTFSDVQERHPWRDNYVDFRPFSFIQLQVGKFKLPFGMEESGAEDRLDFVYRSRVTDFLAPARERGAMLHGDITKRIAYEAGVFRFDGENSDLRGKPTAGRTYAERVSGEPLRYVSFLPKTIRHTYFGVAATQGKMYEGQNAQHGQTISNFTYFDHVFVKGDRRRIGAEVSWSEGPFGIKGEYIRMSEQRLQQGVRENDLPDKISRGWYVTASWIALGKMKSKGKEPKNPLLTGHGFGAIELSGRLDVLTFYSVPGTSTAVPSRSPRAANLLPNSDRTWTFGPTWYINHFAKIQANGEREWITDIERSTVAGRHIFWTGIVRLQFAM